MQKLQTIVSGVPLLAGMGGAGNSVHQGAVYNKGSGSGQVYGSNGGGTVSPMSAAPGRVDDKTIRFTATTDVHNAGSNDLARYTSQDAAVLDKSVGDGDGKKSEAVQPDGQGAKAKGETLAFLEPSSPSFAEKPSEAGPGAEASARATSKGLPLDVEAAYPDQAGAAGASRATGPSMIQLATPGGAMARLSPRSGPGGAVARLSPRSNFFAETADAPKKSATMKKWVDHPEYQNEQASMLASSLLSKLTASPENADGDGDRSAGATGEPLEKEKGKSHPKEKGKKLKKGFDKDEHKHAAHGHKPEHHHKEGHHKAFSPTSASASSDERLRVESDVLDLELALELDADDGLHTYTLDGEGDDDDTKVVDKEEDLIEGEEEDQEESEDVRVARMLRGQIAAACAGAFPRLAAGSRSSTSIREGAHCADGPLTPEDSKSGALANSGTGAGAAGGTESSKTGVQRAKEREERKWARSKSRKSLMHRMFRADPHASKAMVRA